MLEPAGFFVWVTPAGVRVLGRLGDETRLAHDDAVENYFAAQHAPPADERLFTNPDLYRAVGRLRLPRADGLLSLAPSEALESTLARAAHGAAADELARALTDEEISFDDALEFVQSLAERSLLRTNAALQYKSLPRRWARGEALLSRAAVDDLARRLAPPPPNEFVHAFVSRFGDDEVPLLFALDPDAGVRFDGGALDADLVIARCRLEDGRLVHLGQGALSLVSDDEPLAAPLRALHAAETALHPGAIFAELRCPGDAPRISPREFEIACLVAPAAPPEAQLPLADLRLAVADDRPILLSHRLGREVIPRRASEIAPPPGSPLAAFLCALQQNSPRAELDAGHLEIPFLRTTPRPARAPHRIRSRFMPGSEWCELQLFGAPTSLDALVIGLVAPLARALAGRWFYLRGESHLVVALHRSPNDLLARVHALASPFLDDGRLHEYALAPHRRQITRFGGADGIAIAEQIFEADSECSATLLDALDLDDDDARAEVTLNGIARLFDDFGLLPQPIEPPPLDEPVRAVLGARSSRLTPLIAELRGLAEAGRLSRGLAEIVPSHAHFFANRMLRSLDEERRVNERFRQTYWKEESPR